MSPANNVGPWPASLGSAGQALSADIGYPWAVKLPNGDVLVVYYWVTAEGVRSIVATHLSLD